MSYKEDIKSKINPRRNGKIIVEDCLDSTNLFAEILIKNGAENTTVVIADSQTAGAGRRGRSFFSPPEKGIYMSYILHMPENIRNLELLTSAAGLAVCNAIENTFGICPQIKWPNDIFIDGRKVCGILTKLTSDKVQNIITHAVIGIGINVNGEKDDFPDELRNIAGSLKMAFNKECDRAALCAKVIDELDGMLIIENILEKDCGELVRKLAERSCTIGREVDITKENSKIRCRAVGLDSKGGLTVERGGEIGVVTSGEVIHCCETEI